MRARRHVGPSGVEALKATAWRRFLLELTLIAVVAGLGFALSSSWISPGTLLTSEHAVPRVLDLPEAEARTAITALGFRVRLEDERQSPDVPRGAVVWQDPPPDMVMPPGHTVQLAVSAGPAPVKVPDVVGLAQPYAEKIFEAAGLKVGKVDEVAGGDEAGVVLATRPAAGHGRPRGATVDLMVSLGPGGRP
ncbi:MAG: PASTA domain-containing protein [Gemmatimonadales bacterium]